MLGGASESQGSRHGSEFSANAHGVIKDNIPAMNLYVSNLSYGTTDDELNAAFAAYGVVSSARVVLDRESGRSRGFGFVEMPVEAEALTAINSLNGAEMSGRPLRVVEARPKEDRPPRSGGGGGGYPRSNSGGGGGGNDYADEGGGGWKQRDYGDRDRGKGGWDRHKRG